MSSRFPRERLAFICAGFSLAVAGSAQDLAPRAYLITPTGSNALILSVAYNVGDVLLDPTIPITSLKAQFQVPILGYYRSFGFFGRSANVAVAIPYGYGHFEGLVYDSATRISRSGPARLINPGANRWAFKPEIGLGRRQGRWALDGYIGAWLFTSNPQFFPGSTYRHQNAITSFEFHLGYYIKPKMWMSFDSSTAISGQAAAPFRMVLPVATRPGILELAPHSRSQSHATNRSS